MNERLGLSCEWKKREVWKHNRRSPGHPKDMLDKWLMMALRDRQSHPVYQLQSSDQELQDDWSGEGRGQARGGVVALSIVFLTCIYEYCQTMCSLRMCLPIHLLGLYSWCSVQVWFSPVKSPRPYWQWFMNRTWRILFGQCMNVFPWPSILSIYHSDLIMFNIQDNVCVGHYICTLVELAAGR